MPLGVVHIYKSVKPSAAVIEYVTGSAKTLHVCVFYTSSQKDSC